MHGPASASVAPFGRVSGPCCITPNPPDNLNPTVRKSVESSEPQYFLSEEAAQSFYDEKAARESIQNNVARHAVIRLFEELPKDGLVALQGIIETLQTAGATAPVVASFYAGYIAAELQRRFQVCAGCGRSHLDELGTAPK